MLRNGLIPRNPYRNGQIILGDIEEPITEENLRQHGIAKNMEEFKKMGAEHKSHMRDYELVINQAHLALSGSGKTTLIQMILLNYPQVVLHHQYGEHEFLFQHINWLYLECPHNGSPVALQLKIFDEIDDLIHTNFRETHGAVTDKMVTNIEIVNRRLRIGLIVIDEIQRLCLARGKTKDEMMEFLAQFSNTVKVPILLLGTNLAEKLFDDEMQQTRRFNNFGDMRWAYPQQFIVPGNKNSGLEPEWKALGEGLLNCQIIKNPVDEFDTGLSAALFEETAGNKDLVVKVMIWVQARLLENNLSAEEEIITPELIRDVARSELAPLKSVIKGILLKKQNAWEDFEKKKAKFEEEALEKASNTPITVSNSIAPDPIISAMKKALGQVEDLTVSAIPSEDQDTTGTSRTKKPTKKAKAITDKKDLRHGMPDDKTEKKGSIDSLKRRGFIGDASEYVPVEENSPS